MDAEIGSAEYYAERNEQERQLSEHYNSFRKIEQAADECFYLSATRKIHSNIYNRRY